MVGFRNYFISSPLPRWLSLYRFYNLPFYLVGYFTLFCFISIAALAILFVLFFLVHYWFNSRVH